MIPFLFGCPVADFTPRKQIKAIADIQIISLFPPNKLEKSVLCFHLVASRIALRTCFSSAFIDGTCQPFPCEYSASCRTSMRHSLKTFLPRTRALLLACALFSLAGQSALAQAPTASQPWAYLLL